MGNKKVFISHSSKDEELVSLFREFLHLGMNVPVENIFCTTPKGVLDPGCAFIPKIGEELEKCSVLIFLISKQYLESPFCLAELGAAWISKKVEYLF